MSHPKLRRRGLIQAAALGGMGAALAAMPSGRGSRALAQAAAKAQAPGFYRFEVGAFTVTTFSDGNLILQNPKVYAANAPEAEVQTLLAANLLPTDRVVTQTNVTLLDTGERRILFDVGAGSRFQPTAGRLAANLDAAGIDPAAIDLVVVTHAHPDHCWGILDDLDEVRFPKAEFVIGEPEWAFWMAKDRAEGMPDPMKPLVAGAQRSLGAVAERTRRIKPGDAILPGITTIAAPGHTPGHMAVHIASEGGSLLVSADSFTHPVLSLANPGWHFAFDLDPEAAAASRRRVLDLAATDNLWVVGYHMPWPGLGRVARDGQGYRWLPANFVWQL